VAHRFGSRRFDTRDDSRNNWLVSFMTLGEGWHNNHHRYPISARQGLSRWEIDPTWLIIKAMAALRLATDLRPVPAEVFAVARKAKKTVLVPVAAAASAAAAAASTAASVAASAASTAAATASAAVESATHPAVPAPEV
jgi:stearoyl-CoA desaturase (delta-9 desaturase)